MRWLPCLLVLAGCSSEPDWVLIEKKPNGSIYVDARGLKKEGGLLRATLRTVAEAVPGKGPRYSMYDVMLINCEEKSVRRVSHEAVDDVQRVTILKHAMPDVFLQSSKWDGTLPARFCEHVDKGKPLA